VRTRAALIALPALLLLFAVAAGGRPQRSEPMGDGPAISAAAPHDAHAELPALEGAPLAPPVVSLPAPDWLGHPVGDLVACAPDTCGSSFVLSDRPLLL